MLAETLTSPREGLPIGDLLGHLLDHLSYAGLPVSPRDRINATVLVADLIARDEIQKFSALRPWLAPLLSRSPAERERFFEVFDVFDAGHQHQPPVGSDLPIIKMTYLLAIAGLILVAAFAAPYFFWSKLETRHVLPTPPIDLEIPNNAPKAVPEIVKPAAQPALPASKVAKIAPPTKLGIHNKTPEAMLETAEPVTQPVWRASEVSKFVATPRTELEILNRLAEAAERFEGAPTLEELGRELARGSKINLNAAAYSIRISELSGLPRNTPLSLYGTNGRDGTIWAMIALAVERIERPGRESAFAELLAAANEPLGKAEKLLPVYALAQKLPSLIAEATEISEASFIRGIQEAEYRARANTPTPQVNRDRDLIDKLTVQRALAISADPKIQHIFPDAPWMPVLGTSMAAFWAASLASVIPFCFALFWIAISLAFRKAYLRRRPPELPPLHTDLISEAIANVRYPVAQYQRIAQKLRLRTAVATDRLDIETSIALTLAGGGEIPVPVFGVSRPSPEYLVLIERQSGSDQQAERLRELVRRLEEMIPLTVFYYRSDPSWVQPESGKRSVSIEYLQATFPHHRLLILGSGSEFLNPASLELVPAAEKLITWPLRAILTPLPLVEWAREEMVLARELKTPLVRAAPEGLLAAAELLSLEGGQGRNLIDLCGDASARPLPEILRNRQRRFLYAAPPSDLPVPQILQDLRNYLDQAAFEWLCSLAVYPAVQWDLTLYLGVLLPERQGGDAAKVPLYSEYRIAALTQLPWLRAGLMPNWLRSALISQLSPARAKEIRAALLQLIGGARLSGNERLDKAVTLRIGQESAKDRVPPDALFEDEVLLEFLAKGHIEDFALPNSKWLAGILPRGLLDRISIPDLAAGFVALAYAAAAYALAPDAADSALVPGAWLPLGTLFLLACFAFVLLFPSRSYSLLRILLIRISPPSLALTIFFVIDHVIGTLVVNPQNMIAIAAMIFPLALARSASQRIGIPVFITKAPAKRGVFLLAKSVVFAISAILLAKFALEFELVETQFAILPAIPLAIFVAGLLIVHVLPEKLQTPRHLSQRTRINWLHGSVRAGLALLPILPALWLAAYISNASVTLPDSFGEITATAELPKGSLIALASADGTARVLDIASRQPRLVTTIKTGNISISDLALRSERDGDVAAPVVLAVATADGRVRLYDAKGGSPRPMAQFVADIQGVGGKVHVALGEGANLLASWQTAAGETRLTSTYGIVTVAGRGPVTALATLEKNWFAYATSDGGVRLAEIASSGVSVAKKGTAPLRLSSVVRRLHYDAGSQLLTALTADGTLLTLQPDWQTLQVSVANQTKHYALSVGVDVPQDYAKAHEWYEKAAAKDDAVAMRNLGALYENGWGVQQDYAKASEWYEKAAAGGNEDAKTALQKFQVSEAFGTKAYGKAAALQAELAQAIENDDVAQGAKAGAKTASALRSLSWYQLFARQFEAARASSGRAMGLKPDAVIYATNHAHALMFLGREEEARALYLKYKGQRTEKGGFPWVEAILKDFDELEKAGLKHPLMDEIRAVFAPVRDNMPGSRDAEGGNRAGR